jgi:cation transport protein ChaC
MNPHALSASEIAWPPAGADAWVFAYGSLMWDPCFPLEQSCRALLHGWHRSLCILSILNRGTRERPGLALGLDRGGSCAGFAFRIAPAEVMAAREKLWRREMANSVYVPRVMPVRLDGGDRVPALVFVARPGHPQYVGDLAPEQAAALVAQGVGSYGTALDYLRNVVRHLDEFGIKDCPLHSVLRLAETAYARVEKREADR